MSYSLGDLEKEIDVKIDEMRTMGAGEIPADWLSHAVMSDHSSIEGRDADFHLCCSAKTVRDAVRRAVGKYGNSDKAPDSQIVLPGFERLQAYYLITREAHQVMVRIDKMTMAELEAKEAEYMAMGAGCYQHADEIRRYRSLARSAA